MEQLCSYSRQTSTPSYQKAAVTGGLSQVLHAMSCNMTSLCPVPSGEKRSDNSGNVAVFPYLWSVQQNWAVLKKIREYWKQTTRLNQTKISQQLQKRGGVETRCTYYWGHIPQYFSLLLGTLCFDTEKTLVSWHISLGTDFGMIGWSPWGKRCCSPQVLSPWTAVPAQHCTIKWLYW